MPYKDPEKAKENKKQYVLDHKEETKEYLTEYQRTHKEERKQYEKSAHGRKLITVRNWKYQGLKSDNYNEIYERYLNTEICDNCDIQLNQDGGTRKCMDHDHSTGLFRNILCNSCNLIRIN